MFLSESTKEDPIKGVIATTKRKEVLSLLHLTCCFAWQYTLSAKFCPVIKYVYNDQLQQWFTWRFVFLEPFWRLLCYVNFIHCSDSILTQLNSISDLQAYACLTPSQLIHSFMCATKNNDKIMILKEDA